MASYAKHDNSLLTNHFKVSEMDCPCTDCKVTLVNPELVKRLERMREILGTKLQINSGYRCQSYQDQLALRGFETARRSQHLLGNAADVGNGVTPGVELEDAARKAGFLAVGVGKLFVHVDTRGVKVRRWSYKR